MSAGADDKVARMAARLRERLHTDAVLVMDESAPHAGHVPHAGGAPVDGSGGTHFLVRVHSPLFAGKSRLACHRMVYEALGDFLEQGGVHALAIETGRG